MDDISVLEELGFQEVSRKTHIEVKYLKHMANKEFSQLNRINTLGFVKILRREFNLDLTNWVQEYEEYLKNNHKEETQKEGLLTQQTPPKKKSLKWVYILLFFALLCCGFWYFNGIKYVNELKNQWLKDNNASFASAPIVKETKEKLDALEQESTKPQESIKQATTDKVDTDEQTSGNIEQEEKVEEAIAEQPIKESESAADTVNTQEFQSNTIDNTSKQNENNNSTEAKNTQEPTNEVQSIQDTKEPLLSPAISKLTIKPNKKIWIGVINLENKRRKTRLRKEDIKLDISTSQLLVVGHGDFIFDLGNGNTLVPSTKLRSYYHIINKTITPISKEEFKKLNGGKNW